MPRHFFSVLLFALADNKPLHGVGQLARHGDSVGGGLGCPARRLVALWWPRDAAGIPAQVVDVPDVGQPVVLPLEQVTWVRVEKV